MVTLSWPSVSCSDPSRWLRVTLACEWVSEWPTVTLRWHTVTIRWPKVTLGDLLWVILRWLGVTIKWLILTPRWPSVAFSDPIMTLLNYIVANCSVSLWNKFDFEYIIYDIMTLCWLINSVTKLTYYSDHKVTLSDPKVTQSDLKVTQSDPKVTQSDPKAIHWPYGNLWGH